MLPRTLTCAFCAKGHAKAELMFRTDIGGEPACICDRCIAIFGEIITLYQHSPHAAATLIRALNEQVALIRRHPAVRARIEPVLP